MFFARFIIFHFDIFFASSTSCRLLFSQPLRRNVREAARGGAIYQRQRAERTRQSDSSEALAALSLSADFPLLMSRPHGACHSFRAPLFARKQRGAALRISLTISFAQRIASAAFAAPCARQAACRIILSMPPITRAGSFSCAAAALLNAPTARARR